MIPLKLTLENFKCYRRNVPTLHLKGVQIACLCGANGHGKSSLLDAITWALWGEAGEVRSQEELVHIGEQDMRVELEFIAGGPSSGPARGQRYRVIRRYARGRAGRATSLELQVATGPEGEGEFRSISGSSVRETEAQINRLVGMDYTTFVNSAFLVQGRADEFTTKRPAERQQVLGKVLGLELYERLQDRAKEKARDRAAQMQGLQGQVQAWSQQLAQRPEHEAQLPQVEAALAAVHEEVALAAEAASAQQERLRSLQQQRREMEALERQAAVAKEEARQLGSQRVQHGRRVQVWEALAARQSEILQAFARLGELRGQEEALGRLVEPYARLQERRKGVQGRIDALPGLESALAAAQGDLETLHKREETLEGRRTELQGMEVARQSQTEANQRLMAEMHGLRSKVDMLSAQVDARCPLCGRVLGLQDREHIAQEYAAQGRAIAQEYRQNDERLKEAEPRQREMATWIQREEGEVARRRQHVHARQGTLAQQLAEAQKAPAELVRLDGELDALGYAPERHREVREGLKALALADEEHRTLQEALQGLPEEREGLARVAVLYQRRQEALAQAEERMALVRQDVAALPEVERRAREAESRHASSQARRQELLVRQGSLRERLREYGELEKKKAEAELRLGGIGRERQVMEELATAFGRTGVQALIVEAAIPELEADANDLLGRMTDNTMHLKLETQRETQRGDVVETLQIKVSDPLGARSYETFSGGEAFRINLALRIALSKLLARRAGAPLPTLFIDEGFGTQDAAGRERILEVIQTIARDFERILVITHMEEVKEAFPVRIEVQKTEAGSTFVMT